MEENYYLLLGLKSSATQKEITSAFRKLAKVHHPDVAEDKEKATEFFKKLSEAFQCLSDEKKRHAYDAKLARGAFRTAQATGNGGRGSYYAPPKQSSWGENEVDAFIRREQERRKRSAARAARSAAGRGPESASADPVPVVESSGDGVAVLQGLGRGRGGGFSGRNQVKKKGS